MTNVKRACSELGTMLDRIADKHVQNPGLDEQLVRTNKRVQERVVHVEVMLYLYNYKVEFRDNWS